MRRRTALLLAGGLAVVAASLILFTILVDTRPREAVERVYGTPEIGGPFTLTDQHGERFTEANLAGKPYALFFGFTFCPDVCPTTLYELSSLMEELGEQAEALNVVFVSVDWERDGPEEIASYLTAFDPRIHGLSGSEEEIAAVARAYRAYYSRVPLDEGGYTIDHVASVYLMDAKGEFQGILGYGESREVMLEKLRRLIATA